MLINIAYVTLDLGCQLEAMLIFMKYHVFLATLIKNNKEKEQCRIKKIYYPSNTLIFATGKISHLTIFSVSEKYLKLVRARCVCDL